MGFEGLTALLQWIGLFQAIASKGTAAWTNIKKALADNGIEADTSALDAVAVDADRRRAIAEHEAGQA